MALPQTPHNSKHLLKLRSGDLLLGMYVADLDCNWAKTPFPVGGFHVRTTDDIQILQKFCKFIFIDSTRGVVPRAHQKSQLTILSTARAAVPTPASLKIDRDAYPDTRTIKQSIDKAFKLYTELQDGFMRTTQAVRNGSKLQIKTIDKPIEAMIDCIVANPQTLIWLLNTDPTEHKTQNYCVRAAIWATILGRQIGMNRTQMSVLFKGTLLADIGMYLLPERLVNKRGAFRKNEFRAYRKHVEFGMELLSPIKGLDDRILSIVHCHHERHDGLGFPRKLRGEQIPALARFANLAYCFERLLGSNASNGPCSPARAMAKLYKQRVLKFPEQLASEFIHVMGMYPVGTVLKLATNELAIVIEQDSNEKLYPKVAIVVDAGGSVLSEPKPVELVKEKDAQVSRKIVGVPDVKYLPINPRDYAFRLHGTKLALGPLSIRI